MTDVFCINGISHPVLRSDGAKTQKSQEELNSKRTVLQKTYVNNDQSAELYCSGQSVAFSSSLNTLNRNKDTSAEHINGQITSNELTRHIPVIEDEIYFRTQQERKRTLLFTRKIDVKETGSKPAKFRAYIKLDIRVKSFGGWKSDCTLPVWVFARAGFFYKGFADIAACFQCGLTHKHWGKDDDPIVKHLQLQPNCHYITKLIDEGIRSCSDIEDENREENVTTRDVIKETKNFSISSEPSLTTDSTLLCKVCLVNKLEITILPCGHLATCASCCRRLRDENQRCPMCRKPIIDTVNTIIP